MSTIPKIFIAYARKDQVQLDELRTHLTPLERSGKVEIWYDGKIEPGVVWEKAIKDNLHKADIILLLVSHYAIASDYFYDKEMKDALERHQEGSARVVPLILRPCAWKATPLAELQALPKDGKAVTSWPDPHAAYSDAVNSLWAMIQKNESRKAAQKKQDQQRKEQQEAQEKQKAAALLRNKKIGADAEKNRLAEVAQHEKAVLAKKERQRQKALKNQERSAQVNKIVRHPVLWGSLITLLLGFGIFKACNFNPALDDNTIAVPSNTNSDAGDAASKVADQAADVADNANPNVAEQEKKPTVSQPSVKIISNIVARLEQNMVNIPAGSFTMGCTSEQTNCADDEKPTRTVSIASFKMGKYEVTQAEWRAVMGKDPEKLNFKGCDQCPVERVSWDDIQGFLKELNRQTGNRYRLPSEAEWEYAARGGQNYKYAGSDNITAVAWHKTNSESKTHPVGKLQSNGFGLYDMSGNVWEWCQDRWHSSYSGGPTDGSAWESGSSSYRVYRGGGWSNNPENCRVSNRNGTAPDYRSYNLGFRLALSR